MSWAENIFHRIRDERLSDVGEHEITGPLYPVTELLPLVDGDPPWAGDAAGAEDLTHDDYLARRTDNGLRPDDAALPQPPQDPEWRPDADG